MQKITPSLWFDGKAEEAANFYVSLFDDAAVTDVQYLEGTPSGDHVALVLRAIVGPSARPRHTWGTPDSSARTGKK